MNVHSGAQEMADTTIYHEDRTAAILEGAKTAFAEKGFDGASMQDLARAAGMSAGNFYRYFPSKNAIVEALIARDIASVRQDFALIEAASNPAEGLYDAMERRIDSLGCDTMPLWAEIEAAAMRRPEVASICRGMECEVCGFLTAVFARIAGISQEAARIHFTADAAFLVLLFKGAIQFFVRPGADVAPEVNARVRHRVLAAVRQTIDAVTAFRVSQEESNP